MLSSSFWIREMVIGVLAWWNWTAEDGVVHRHPEAREITPVAVSMFCRCVASGDFGEGTAIGIGSPPEEVGDEEGRRQLFINGDGDIRRMDVVAFC